MVRFEIGIAGRERVKMLFTWERTASTILEHLTRLKSREDGMHWRRR